MKKINLSIIDNWQDDPECKRPIPWATGSGIDGICFLADVDGSEWKIRLKDFPPEPIHTLIIDGM